jgi:hypothetical protein
METRYELKPAEQRQYEEIVEGLELHGGLYRTDRDGNLIGDAAGNPIPADYVVLRSRRFLVDAHGVLWRFFPEGSRKSPDVPDGGGAPWRNNRVEMWTGRWRKVTGGGETTWAKVLSPRPIDKRINGHPGMSQIDWYRTRKGYKHPLEAPHEPSACDLAALAAPAVPTEVRARLSDKLRETVAEDRPTPPRSNNRDRTDAAG